ncbi:MAG: sigma-54-dependent transcriptional regulator [Planctomycetota bacterium]
MPDKPQVLVVDNDPELLSYLGRALRVDGYPVDTCADAEAALGHLARRDAAVVVADVFLEGLNGVELLKELRERYPGTEVVLIGRDVPTYTVVSAMKLGAADFVEKPIDIEHFQLCIGRAVERAHLARENQRLRRVMGLLDAGAGEMVAASPRMQEVLQQVDLVAPTDIRVLIEGESGVGKELVAQRIHQRSTRRDEAFVALNCGAIQQTLLESELFGHKKGAFTGATADHRGLFEVADRGTLFLDEIGEMNLDLQVKLLRVLERSEFRPVGGTKTVHVDVRVVAATNKTLADEVAGGRFREDLYYRLNVIHVKVPPLRERRADIPPLVETFLAAHRRRGLPRKEIAPEAIEALCRYPFPGNVRELRNVVERCQILSSGAVIERADLPPNVLASSAPAQAGGNASAGAADDDDRDLETPLAEIERRHILRVLDANEGNKLKTARVLGINVKTLYNKLKAYEQQ